MSLRYSGPAVLHCETGIIAVHADLSTNLGSGVYSWTGRLHTDDIAALRTAGQGGTLALPDETAADMHIAHAEPDPGGGVLVRVHGNGRAPFERDGEITATPREDGGTYYQAAE